MKSMKKTALTFSIIISVLFLFALSVSAAQASGDLLTSYSEICHEGELISDSILLPSDALFIYNSDLSPSISGVSSVKRGDSESETHFTDGTVINGTFELSFNFSIDQSDISDLTDKMSIGFGVLLKGNASEENTLPRVRVTLTISAAETDFISSVTSAAGVPTVLYADLSEIPDSAEISSVSLSLKYEGDEFKPSSLRISDPFLTESISFGFMRTNLLKSLSVLSGAASISEDSITLYTNKSDVVMCAGQVSRNDHSYNANESKDTVSFCSVGISEGSVSAAEYVSDPKSVQSYVSMPAGRGCGMLRISSPIEKSGAIVTFRSNKNETAVLDSLMLYKTGEPCEALPCLLTSLTVADGKLKAEGRLDENIVREHKRDSLGIYKISPIDQDGEGELLGKVGMSSRFSIDVPIDEYPHARASDMFYIAVTDSEGEKLRVSESRFAAAAVPENSVTTPFGLYGADPVSVYESNAGYVLFDVALDSFFESSAKSKITLSSGGYVFSASSDYLREIDDRMNSYLSSGVSVYLRLVCKSPVKSSTDGAMLTYSSALSEEFLFRTDSEEAQNMYLAAVTFFCGRYPQIASIVLSSGINSSEFVGRHPMDLYKYASEIALAARLIDGAASEVNENIFVTIPLTAEADKNAFASPEAFCALFAERLSKIGHIPWAVMYDISDVSDIAVTDGIVANLRALSLSAPMFSLHTYTPHDMNRIAEEYADLCGVIGMTSARIIFLSAAESLLSQTECRLLKQSMKTSSSLLIDSTAQSVGSLLPDKYSSLSLWDFSSSYSSEGWSSGYGVGTFGSFTEPHNGNTYSRVLRCTTDTGDGVPAGMMLCSPPSDMNISQNPYIEFVFSVSSGTPKSAVFIFGSGENRAEFNFSFSPDMIEKDGKYHAVCDLSEYGKTDVVGYIGIIIYADENVSFDLSEVNAISIDGNAAELENIFIPAPEENEIESMKKTAVVASLFVIILSAAVSLKIAVAFRKKDAYNLAEMKKNAKKVYR
ncbi:MAG: hypothetical protein HFE30_07005 [Clostridiales bacterium]|nr:hypothetical protein [Clostridiales bacterium]